MNHFELLAVFWACGGDNFRNMFCHVEDHLSSALKIIADQSVDEAHMAECLMTLHYYEDKGKELPCDADGNIGIDDSYDMYLPHHGSSGRKYISKSGCASLFALLSVYIIGRHVFFQSCCRCDEFDAAIADGQANEGDNVLEHCCPRNFPKTKSLQTMETAAAVIMTKVLHDCGFGVFCTELSLMTIQK